MHAFLKALRKRDPYRTARMLDLISVQQAQDVWRLSGGVYFSQTLFV